MNTPMRYAIVGCAAGIAVTHLQALANLPGAQIVGMSDIDAVRGAARAATAGCPFYTDHRTMLKEVQADIAVICTPHPFHAPIAIDCLQAGAHVLVEKPLAVEVAEADAMIAAAAANERILAVNYQMRFRSAVEYVRAMIDSGELGSLVRVLCVEPWYRTAAYYRSAAWRGTWKGEGGGVLLNQAPHTLDLLCYLVGLPARVFGWTRTFAHAIECEDYAQAMLEYANGAGGYLQISTVEAGLKRRLEIVGDRAAIELIGDQLTIRRFTPSLSEFRATSQEMWAAPVVAVETLDLTGDAGHLEVHQDLVAAIHEGRQPRCNAIEGRMSLELANAIILSSYTDRPVKLPIDRAEYTALLADLRAGKR